MTNIAQGRLRILDEESVNISEQVLSHQGYFFHDMLQVIRGDPERFARYLHQAAVRRTHGSENGRHAHKAEATDDCNLHRTVALARRDQGCDSALDEVDVLDGSVMLLK